MNAVEYLKAKGRMTNGCKHSCDECLLNSENNGIDRGCAAFEGECPEKAIAIVEKWSKEHPIKTYLSVLLEKLPNVSLRCDGVPDDFCLHSVFKIKNDIEYCSRNNCTDCWNREYKEEK